LKNTNPEEITNYRPVSLLTTISKIFEKILYTRLLKILKEQNILYISQFGFRENNSTYMAIISLLDKIIEALDSGRVAIGIFIDFSKAFDTVNHSILLDKMEHYGIRGTAKGRVASYLRDRQQYCTYLDSKSTMKTMKCGVPQGSILGPLLFLLYINDMGEIFNKFTPILFADDSNLVATGKDTKEIESIANQELPILIDWLQANRLSNNIKKTHVMNFGNSRKKPHLIPS
jgi:retron-type reverse transcriptase